MPEQLRGLIQFIRDIRNCRSREEEEKRINKEMANIRSNFKEGKMTSYDKKKYVCKMLYIYILGFELDFGHAEALNLITGVKYSEKQVGYLAVTLLLSENNELARMVINGMRQDLTSPNETFNCLSLAAIAAVGGREMADSLHQDVLRLLVDPGSKGVVQKKAALTLLRLFRKSPEVLPAADWADRIVPLMDHIDMGVALSVATLITALAQEHTKAYSGCVPKAIDRLDRIVNGDFGGPDYEYYRVPIPWLQVKLMRLLQYYPPPDGRIRQLLNKTLGLIIGKAADPPPKTANQSNALNATIFEAINLAIYLDPSSELVIRSIHHLGAYISHKETNLRYLGLETMANVALAVDSLDEIKRHTDTILHSLNNRDISVRRRGLDLLYSMCDATNSRRIVGELLQYLSLADYAIREELVLKIAILAERFATEFSWYVDVILQLIASAGDQVSEEVWYRVIQIITNNEDLQAYAARQLLRSLKSMTWHETTVKVAGYVLGEFGDWIANEPGCAPIDQFNALHSKFGYCSLATRAILLSTYIKFANIFPEIKDQVDKIFRDYSDVLDIEMQQRACEYMAISPNQTLLETVFDEMPPFKEKAESALVSLVKKKEGETTDRRIHKPREKKKAANLAARGQPSGGGSNNGATTISAMTMSQAANSSSSSSSSSSSGGGFRSAGGGAASPSPAAASQPKPSSATADILGLGDFQDAFGAPPSAGTTSSAAAAPWSLDPTPGTEPQYLSLLSEPTGILFEDALLQIGVKSEYHLSKGRLALYFKNRGGVPFAQFSSKIVKLPDGLTVTKSNAVNATLQPGEQAMQLFELECIGEFSSPPLVSVSFGPQNSPRVLTLRLPVAINKFVEGITLGKDDFFGRWKSVGGPPREVQLDFQSAGPIDVGQVRAQLVGFQLTILDDVDSVPTNFILSGIFHTSSARIGCLVRIQTNQQARAFRVTLRTTNASVSKILGDMIMAKLLR